MESVQYLLYICGTIANNKKPTQMKNLTPTEKKKLLAKMLELMVSMGCEIEPYMGLPLSKFNFDNVQKQIDKLKVDLEYVHSEY